MLLGKMARLVRWLLGEGGIAGQDTRYNYSRFVIYVALMWAEQWSWSLHDGWEQLS